MPIGLRGNGFWLLRSGATDGKNVGWWQLGLNENTIPGEGAEVPIAFLEDFEAIL